MRRVKDKEKSLPDATKNNCADDHSTNNNSSEDSPIGEEIRVVILVLLVELIIIVRDFFLDPTHIKEFTRVGGAGQSDILRPTASDGIESDKTMATSVLVIE